MAQYPDLITACADPSAEDHAIVIDRGRTFLPNGRPTRRVRQKFWRGDALMWGWHVDGRHKRQRFEKLVKPELDALYRLARRTVGNRATAEELVQEACLRAFEAFDLTDEPTNFRPWMFRVQVNVCIDFLRRRGRDLALPIDAHAEAVESCPDLSVSACPEQVLESRAIGASIERALASLAPELRVVVILVLIEELSYADAAESLSIPERLVKSRLHRARESLRDALRTELADQPKPVSADRAMELRLACK